MDVKKIIDAIDAIKANYPPMNYTMLREGLDLAIEALEKQIPNKPTSPYGEKFSDCVEPFPFVACVCPSCNQEVPYVNYCLNCGQKLDWGVE